MHYDIRGGLGMQVLSLFGAIAHSIENKTPLTSVALNFGNYTDPRVREPNVNYIKDIFPNVNFHIYEKEGTEKFRPYTYESSRLIAKHYWQIRDRLGRFHSAPLNNQAIVHIRQRDRALIDPQVMIDRFCDEDDHTKIISDDSLPGVEENSAIYDWWQTVYSTNVYSTFSTFTISAAIVNPLMKLNIVKKKYCKGGIISEDDWKGLDGYTYRFHNIRWIDL